MVSAKIVVFNWGSLQDDELQVACRFHASGAIDEASSGYDLSIIAVRVGG